MKDKQAEDSIEETATAKRNFNLGIWCGMGQEINCSRKGVKKTQHTAEEYGEIN